MKSLLLSLSLLTAAALRADGAPQGLTATVELAGLQVSQQYLSVKPADGYVRIMIDLFPYRAQRTALGDKFSFKALAEALVKGPALASQPKMRAFKVDIAEYTQRDDYALPVFSSYKPLWHAEGRYDPKHGVSFKKVVEK
jgi:hypothetical protein